MATGAGEHALRDGVLEFGRRGLRRRSIEHSGEHE
jgi:hypothetical protein